MVQLHILLWPEAVCMERVSVGRDDSLAWLPEKSSDFEVIAADVLCGDRPVLCSKFPMQHSRGTISVPGIPLHKGKVIAAWTFQRMFVTDRQIQQLFSLATRIVPNCGNETGASLGEVKPIKVLKRCIR